MMEERKQNEKLVKVEMIELTEEEKEQIRQDVYQKIHYLTNKLKTM